MKYLKYIFLSITVFIIGFLLIGVIKPSITYICEATVDKPLSESWAVSMDETKLANWLIGYQKTELVSGVANTVGAVSNIYFMNDGQEMIIQETITKIVPNKSLSMVFTTDFMTMDYKIAMSTTNKGTKVKTTTKARGNGIIQKSIVALISGSIEKQEKTNIGHLKTIIEKNTDQYVSNKG